MLQTDFFAANVICLVVEEVHKVTWGASSNPFREAFGRINELHSLIEQDLPVLALSATVNVDITNLVMSSCSLSQSVTFITEIIDRQNITLHSIKLKSKSSEPLYRFWKDLKHLKIQHQKL